MARDPQEEFSSGTKLAALARQDFLCAMCASLIVPFGSTKLVSVAWGESAHAHHRRPMQMGGSGTEHNCVVICSSCHYTAHFGGNYGQKFAAKVQDFKYFYGTKGRARE